MTHRLPPSTPASVRVPVDRRDVLGAAGLGITSLVLPAASAAASDGGGGSAADLTAPTEAALSLGINAAFAVTSSGDHAYVSVGSGSTPHIAKVDVAGFEVVGQVLLSESGDWGYGITTDDTDVFVGTDDGTIYRVALTGGGGDTGGLNILGEISLDFADRDVRDVVRSGQYLYVLTSSNPARIVKIALTGGGAGTGGMLRVGALALDTGETSAWRMVAIDGTAYALMVTDPGRLVAVDLNDDSGDLPVRLGGVMFESGESNPVGLVASGGDVFATTLTSPSTLLRYATSGGGAGTGGLLRSGALTLTSTNEVRALAASGGYLFAGSYTSTRTVVRIALSGGDPAAGGMRIDDSVGLPFSNGYTSLHDAVVVGTRVAFVSRSDPGYLTRVATGF